MTTINIPVAASSDDAYENNAGTVTLNGVSVGAQLNNIDEWAGFRFLNVTIPAATINSASMTNRYTPSTARTRTTQPRSPYRPTTFPGALAPPLR
jgi:hypothetical protein